MMLIIAKNDFLVKDEGPTYGIHGRFGLPEKKVNINFSRARTNFSLSYKMVKKVIFFNGKEIFMLRTDNKNGNFPTKFWLRSIPYGFHVTDSRAVSLEGKVYNFSVDSNDIDKSEILNIHMYLTVKSSIKV